MNKGVLKASVLVLTFVAAVVLFSALTNKTNRDMTAEMKEATLPTIDLYYQEEAINRLYGYVDEMNAVYMRGDITPIEADSLLPISVRCGSYAVDAISYEIRSMDTERLVADAQVSDYQQENGIITADLTIQNLLEENQEYILMITLEHGEEAVRYYSRIIKAPDYHVQDSIEFVKDFHTRSFGEKDYTTLATYMEPDASADNTTLANVSIHSRLKQVGWADFEGTPVRRGGFLDFIALDGTGHLYLPAEEQQLFGERGLTGIGVCDNRKGSSSLDFLIGHIVSFCFPVR